MNAGFDQLFLLNQAGQICQGANQKGKSVTVNLYLIFLKIL